MVGSLMGNREGPEVGSDDREDSRHLCKRFCWIPGGVQAGKVRVDDRDKGFDGAFFLGSKFFGEVWRNSRVERVVFRFGEIGRFCKFLHRVLKYSLV